MSQVIAELPLVASQAQRFKASLSGTFLQLPSCLQRCSRRMLDYGHRR